MTENDMSDVTMPDCALADRDSRIAGYVAGTLAADEAEVFEAHYFACDACFSEVRQAIEIRASAAPVAAPLAVGSSWYWLAAAASVVLAFSAWWFSSNVVPDSPPAAMTSVLPSPAPSSGAPAGNPASTPGPDAAAPEGRAPATALAVPIAVLARVDPPVYLPVSLRGSRDESADRFEAAMRRYTEKDYAGAIPSLDAAVRLDPNSPHATFFLAICRLLTGDVGPAAEGLQKTIDLGESAYVEEAHFYLAKARLRQNNLTGARDELKRTIGRRGALQTEATQLLSQVDLLLPQKGGK